MKLQHTPTLATDLSSSYILLDSTAVINASQSDDFLSLLTTIVGSGCIFTTIPSVVYEFTRGSVTVEQYKKQLEFIKDLGITVFHRVEETVDSEQVFMVAYNKSFDNRREKGPSYTDSLLCAVAYKHRNSNLKIMTANHKDIPPSIFDRTELITIDIGGDIRTEAIYEFSETKFTRILRQLENT